MTDPQPTPDPQPAVLSYASPGLHVPDGGTREVAAFATLAESGMYQGLLESAGIPSHVIGQATDSLTSQLGRLGVSILVRTEDAERAADVLRDAAAGDVEPAAIDPDAPPPTDEEGNRVVLVTAGAFDHPRLLLEAAATLAAARVRVYVPKLVARGERPPGEGKRFLLRVEDDDLDRARQVLGEAADEEQAEGIEPRCPKCRSYRLWKTGNGIMSGISRLFGGAGAPEGYECLACKHRGEAAEFLPASTI